ncbi:thioesterase II family protein [Streptacidiphilus fuscans]|uniref:Thioesterase n=1 Tax=Streptacidiphilus fuscans TaxID=2789292 RepID=A0A931B330_9ACTN|nr:alpha/beta fold hydrolase [Streptacidiphilus fuscans]MBF9069356.1 thioesterase [Streptacidiphilus fuscans]
MTTTPGTATPWLRITTPRPNARLRLVCLHPAGAGPMFFRTWDAALPEDVEVAAVQLPGRESRFAEKPVQDFEQAVAALHAALRPVLTGSTPYALFGHSMGALLAYGLAVAARRHGDPEPVRLFFSGSAGPGVPRRHKGRHAWTDAEIVADLRAMGGTPEEVLADRELLELILPPLRADYALCDTFESAPTAAAFGAARVLTCPVSILGGEDDDYSAADLARWSAVTSGPSVQRVFPGGHFFLTSPSADAVHAAVRTDLGL